MGRNGSGKSSLLWALQGSGPRQSGTVDVGGADPGSLSPAKARSLVGLVPQTPADLLYLDTVAQECAQADRESAGGRRRSAGGAGGRRGAALLDRLAPGIPPTHPRTCPRASGCRWSWPSSWPRHRTVLLLDEPTRGLDYPAKRALIAILDGLVAGGRSVVVSTHDVEFVAAAADRVVVMGAGDIVADGPAPDGDGGLTGLRPPGGQDPRPPRVPHHGPGVRGPSAVGT